MVEEKFKYDFKTMINDITKYNLSIELDDSIETQLQQILYKLNNIDCIIENTNEEFVNAELETHYTNCINYIVYIVDGNSNYISTLDNELDSILNIVVRYIDYNMIFNNKTGIRNYIKNFKTKITKQCKLLNEELENTKKFVEEKRKLITDNTSQLNVSIDELENKISDLKSSQEQIKSKVDTALTSEIGKIENELLNKKNELNEKLDKNFDDLSIDYQEKFDKLLSDIQTKNQQISKLIGLVGKKSKIGEYNKSAESAHRERLLWQLVTVFLFILAFIFLIYLTLNTDNYNKLVVFKFIVNILLFSSSIYTAKQAANARKDELYFKKQELELASIDVYLESMDPQAREEIKKRLADKMFGQAHNTYNTKYEDTRGIEVHDFIKIIDALKSLIKQ